MRFILGAGGAVYNVVRDCALAEPDPLMLLATTVKEYVVPLLRPVIVHDVEVVAHDCPPGCAIAVYVTGDTDGTAPHANVALAFPIVTAEIDGAIGMPSGVTVVVAAVALVPKLFAAVTDTVYVTPFVKPVMVHEKAVVVQPAVLGVVVTTYVSADVPLKPSGSNHEISDCPEPVEAATVSGEQGRLRVDPTYNKRFGERVARATGYVTAHPVALMRMKSHTCKGVAVGLFSRYSATMPATCGVAIDVPFAVAWALSVV